MEAVVVDLAAPTRCFAHRFVVPGVEKDSELALGRKRAPIPPRRRSLCLLGRARAERDDADMTRIHPFGQLVRGFAAAARVDPRKNDQNRAASGLGKIELRVQQRLAQRRLLAQIDLLRDLVTDFRGFEHGSFCVSSVPEWLGLGELAPGAIGIGKDRCLGTGEPAANDADTVDKPLGVSVRPKLVENPLAGCQVIQVAQRPLQLAERGEVVLGAGAGKKRREKFRDIAKLLGRDASLVALGGGYPLQMLAALVEPSSAPLEGVFRYASCRCMLRG